MKIRDMYKASAQVRAGFKYKADGWADNWKIGKWEGDCEDFALLVLWLICNKSKTRVVAMLMKGEARIIRTKTSSGAYHAVLEYKGHYIDNRYPWWSKTFRDEYKVFKPYSRPMLALKLAFGKLA